MSGYLCKHGYSLRGPVVCVSRRPPATADARVPASSARADEYEFGGQLALQNSKLVSFLAMLTALNWLSQPLYTFVENDLPLRVVTYAIGMTLLGEIVSWILIYRTSSFRQLKKDFESYVPPKASASPGSEEDKKDSKDKREAKEAKRQQKKAEDFASRVGKKMAVVQVVSGVLTMATMIFSIKAVPKIFGDEPAGTLPFQPPGFLQKITQRGLTGEMEHDARDFGPFFVFMLCQSSVRLVVQRLMGLGPSRKMLLFKPDLSKLKDD